MQSGYSFDNFTLPVLIELRDLGKNASAAPALKRRVETKPESADASRKEPKSKPSKSKPETGDSDDQDEFTAAYAREHLAKVHASTLSPSSVWLTSVFVGSLGGTR